MAGFLKGNNQHTPMLYAIGDVHGHCDLLLDLIDKIHVWHKANAQARPAHLITLGDYVDRGPKSRQVIEYLMEGVPGFEKRIHLKGNHEANMIDAIRGESRDEWARWEYDGGLTTLESYDYFDGGIIPAIHVDWLERLPLYYVHGAFCFVHAGILPGRPLEEQRELDLLWIREQFLSSRRDHGHRVIHGHTITSRPEPEVKKNRIGIDTGAYQSGCLSAVGLDPSKRKSQRPVIFSVKTDDPMDDF